MAKACCGEAAGRLVLGLSEEMMVGSSGGLEKGATRRENAEMNWGRSFTWSLTGTWHFTYGILGVCLDLDGAEDHVQKNEQKCSSLDHFALSDYELRCLGTN